MQAIVWIAWVICGVDMVALLIPPIFRRTD